MFFLARYMDSESVGYYGIFTATIGYGIFFIGVEFHVYVTRQILSVEKQERGNMLKGHAALSGLLYLAWLPFIAIFLYKVGWPEHLFLWFVPILFFEHFNQEVFRILVVMQKQITASILLFVRQGSWAFGIMILMTFVEDSRSLDIIMLIWLLAGAITAILGIRSLRSLEIGGWKRPISWVWVRRGLLVATPFLIAILAQRGILTFDRYWLKSLGGIEVVGSYVLFFGMVSALSAVLDAGVFSYTYPELIKHHLRNERAIARAKVLTMLYQTLAISVGFSVVCWLLIPIILTWIGNPIYVRHIGMFPWLLLAMTIYAVSQVLHWGLYAAGKDKAIVISHVAAIIAFVTVTWMASEKFGPYAVLIGLNSAFSMILLLKTIAYRRFINEAHSP